MAPLPKPPHDRRLSSAASQSPPNWLEDINWVYGFTFWSTRGLVAGVSKHLWRISAFRRISCHSSEIVIRPLRDCFHQNVKREKKNTSSTVNKPHFWNEQWTLTKMLNWPADGSTKGNTDVTSFFDKIYDNVEHITCLWKWHLINTYFRIKSHQIRIEKCIKNTFLRVTGIGRDVTSYMR